MSVHIMKLVVGCNSIEELENWQNHHQILFNDKPACVVQTRNKPKQSEEILKTGGSIFRVIKGSMCCRQRIIGFDTIETEDGKKCLIMLDPQIIKTRRIRKRPFQGWRYLKADDAPEDLDPNAANNDDIPIEIELKRLGLL